MSTTTPTPKTLRWTSADLEFLPEDGKRYEIIDGELLVSRQPDWHHQAACGQVYLLLQTWSKQTGKGRANLAPGILFADDDDVAPDVVWISNERLATALQGDGKLHGAPELVVEVLSFTGLNEKRDREAKLKLYSRKDVSEYWMLNWRTKEVEIYRREQGELRFVAKLDEHAALTTPLLEGFSCPVAEFFE